MKMTLRARLVMLVMVCLVPLLGLALVEAWMNADDAIKRATHHLEDTASLAAANQQKVVELAHQMLVSIAHAPGLADGKTTDCQRYLGTLKDQFPVYAAFGLIGLDGYVVCHSESKRPLDFFGDRKYFQAALAQRGFVAGGYLVSRATGTPVVVFAMPVTNREEKVTAVAFAAVDLDGMSKAVTDMPMAPGHRVVILDRQGIVLVAHPEKSAVVGQRVPSPFLREAVRTMRASHGEGADDGQGLQRVFAFKPIGADTDASFFVAASEDKDSVLAPVWKELRLESTLAGLLAFLGGWIAWMMGGRAIVKPTTELLEATRQLQQGQLDVRIPISAGDDAGEFSRIAAGFNRMAESLQTQRAALEAELVRSRAVQEKMQDAQRLGRIGYWQSNLDTRTVWWSDEVYEVLGVDRALLGNTFDGFLERVHPDDREAFDAAREAATEAGIPLDREFRVVTPTGEARWVHLYGRAHVNAEGEQGMRRAGVLQDVTAQHESQAHLRLLETCISHLNDMVVITEAEPAEGLGRRIVFVNEAYERRTGYRREEVLGKAPRMLWGPKTQRAEHDRIGAALKKWQPVRAELINYTKSGEEFWVELDIVPIADATGRVTHWVAVERDITERKLAEQELRDSEQRYAALFEAAPVPMYVFDVVTHQFLAVNQAAIKSYGYSAEEFLSMTIFDISPKSEHDRVRQNLTEQVRWRKGNWQHRYKDASVSPVEIFSKSVQHAGRAARFAVALDISAQVKAEKEVAEHLFMLQRAADAAQAITWHQTLQGTLHEVAEQARGVIGTHQAAVILTHGNDWAQAINALSLSEKYAEHLEQFEPVDGSGIRALVCETNRALRMTQAELEAHPRWRGFGTQQLPTRGWLAVPLTARDGKNIGLLQLSDKYEGEFTQQDEYVAMELAQLASSAIENARLIEEVSQLNTGLEQKVAERTTALRVANQELEAFSYSVSHDLRSPLNTIDGFSQLLAKQLAESDNEKVRHYLSRIRAGTAQMGQLIGDLLSLAHVARTQMNHEPVDLSILSRGILDDLQARQPERRVALYIEPGLQAQGDAGLLRVVVENLLGNAWKYSSKQDEAAISVGQKLDAAGEPVFFVQDNGAGFDMAYADKLFHPFQRLHAVAEFPGTGIGLATVSRVIARHGGRTWADAAPARGATFFFTLPKVPVVG